MKVSHSFKTLNKKRQKHMKKKDIRQHPASYFGLAPAPHLHHKWCSPWLHTGERIIWSDGSSRRKPPRQLHHMHPPLPGEEAGVRGDGGHTPSIAMPKKTLQLGLEMGNMVGGVEQYIVGGQWISCGPEQPSGNSRCPRRQHTWTALVHPSARLEWGCHVVCPRLWWEGRCCSDQGWHGDRGRLAG